MSRVDAVAGLRVGAEFAAGMTHDSLRQGIEEAYAILDSIDHGLLSKGYPRFAKMVELANLSSVVGNVLAEGIVKHSSGVFSRAGAHKYQDLRANPNVEGAENIEIKMALGKNKPKGHLAKGGHYLTCRYVLGDHTGAFKKGVNGDVVWIWEVRLGVLSDADFSISNTAGDSGKTAVVTSDAFKRLKLVYLDERFFPYSKMERYLKEYGGG
jgi:hypothetical protein